jgi:hypothetical protein
VADVTAAFGCPVTFDAPHTSLIFRADAPTRRCRAGRDLTEQNERLVGYLAKLDRSDIRRAHAIR